MKKIVILIFILFLVAAAFAAWFYINIMPPSTSVNNTYFHVENGESASLIANNLFGKGYIKNPNLFRLYLKLTGDASKIQSGDYQISPMLNLMQVANILVGNPLSLTVTIPEGFNRQEIAVRLTEKLNKSKTFTAEFLKASEPNEGYLFPDTYSFAGNASAAAVVSAMLTNFETRTKGMNLTRDQVILASIIEKETKGIEERPIVAGILMNRLKIGMPIQVDVAPITYEEAGLPEKPISNPGLISLKASASPSETDYWYYIHDPTGTIHYARTLDEQNANIQRYLR
jgi:UPF0755 protein